MHRPPPSPRLRRHLLHCIATLILTINAIVLSIYPENKATGAEKGSVPNIVLILVVDIDEQDIGGAIPPLRPRTIQQEKPTRRQATRPSSTDSSYT